MMSSTSNIRDRGLTPEQVRSEAARKDRAGWFPGRHASGEFGILAARDGREVARCNNEADRDFLVIAARNHDALIAALEEALDVIRIFHGPQAWDIYRDKSPEMQRFHAVLKSARGEP